MKALQVRTFVRRKFWFHRQIGATRTTRYFDGFFIISKTNLSLSCMLVLKKTGMGRVAFSWIIVSCKIMYASFWYNDSPKRS